MQTFCYYCLGELRPYPTSTELGELRAQAEQGMLTQVRMTNGTSALAHSRCQLEVLKRGEWPPDVEMRPDVMLTTVDCRCGHPLLRHLRVPSLNSPTGWSPTQAECSECSCMDPIARPEGSTKWAYRFWWFWRNLVRDSDAAEVAELIDFVPVSPAISPPGTVLRRRNVPQETVPVSLRRRGIRFD